MTGLQEEKKLPFKRTVKRKSNEVTDDDGLSLFSRSGEFFEEQQRLAKEKLEKEKAEKAKKDAKKEQERKERLARERQAEEDALNEQLESESANKRRRISLSDDDDDDVFGFQSSRHLKSPSLPKTPTSKRESSNATSTRNSGGRPTRSRPRRIATPINLDDEDDDEPIAFDSPSNRLSPQKSPTLKRSRTKRSSESIGKDVIALDDSGTQPDTGEDSKTDKEDDVSEYYVRQAIERRRKAEEERKTREGSGGKIDDDPVVQILIYSHVQGTHTLLFRRKISQGLNVVYRTWVEQQIAKHSGQTRSVLETMFFTWKGNKVYPHTTLQTLGIRAERDGGLYPDWKGEQEGYKGRDKVFFEAWTQELYDEYLKEKEKERLRQNGELSDEEEPDLKKEPEQPQDSQEGKKVRISFKAKDGQNSIKATVRSNTTAFSLIKLYQKLAKIPEDKIIELRWDGEVLEPDTTIEQAEIEDLDSVEVYIK
ncbi:uncharacterized protein F4822DRAFT_78239 [Hypoxylon trugodes]|uniref:uncharacterized protein n=1 Tax=Hypoxylon trugodes TaxID=326681 RepID=UPI00219FECE9|nr:uncharacterized protein F4822DRAFT_78239 [Hypoxylon trugodes]KAI1383455.1 hypothetical protein F4822DRAFT_78239 [Hypoxylon trugodes]